MENTVRDELIELRGLRFHYREWACARAAAPDLVLLHGYTSHARSCWINGGTARASGHPPPHTRRRRW